MFHRIILYVIHKCIDTFFFLQLLFREINSLVQYSLSLFPEFLKFYKSTTDFNCKRLPTHLGIIICEDKISFSDVSNLIVWSFAVGIHHISIFDSSGYIKLNGNALYKEMIVKKNLILKDAAHYFDIIFSDGKAPFPYNVSIKNGHRTENVNVYLISQEDGKQQIVEAAKKVSKNIKREPDLLKNFHSLHLDQCIKGVINIPDPELVILFGLTNGLIGYLPWHIRLTEFISQLTHHGFSFEEFRKVLQRYNKCEQRFGR
ncbi:dehydrodolichyl diphosphate synthase complex subunit nus1 isoform X2 [Parasteatoda tepidariorum]|uniref:dehydrodolichyl diphosphate synthase complex subunit nus1 isoform X1 n=1 Tax=Parasteatoda tepidariorum TaxID=114398 RepID=UPI00077F9AC2|nr:dehydrodolichyl diphosphate synthase complex subunit nus1 isoform X1 [Parasteatoda tepidariorum]XP_042896324.1 dehydrodolichyl diphosphate synthase complex subunit nus1 isoform X2 [Parasteatoda tepidariorum]